jgi:ABC-2 type transport system ATP-binding protein
MAKIIEFNQVYKSFGKKKVLEKVSFALEEGKFITLIGCNGAGKSTTLRLLAGVEKPESGQVSIMGHDPFSFDYPHRPEIFFIHENYDLNFSCNLLEMVKVYKEVFPRFKTTIFNQILKDRKISLKKNFSDLSRGQKMQFLLMLALAARPKILFLDEITAVIDIEGQRYFLDKLKSFVDEGGTVLITTNILSELNDYTDHLILIQETKLMVNESVSNLQKKFLMLKKTADHPVFSHPKAAKIRKDYDGKEMFLIPREVMDEDTQIRQFLIEHPPKLEDILILHFHLKQEKVEDELVA